MKKKQKKQKQNSFTLRIITHSILYSVLLWLHPACNVGARVVQNDVACETADLMLTGFFVAVHSNRYFGSDLEKLPCQNIGNKAKREASVKLSYYTSTQVRKLDLFSGQMPHLHVARYSLHGYLMEVFKNIIVYTRSFSKINSIHTNLHIYSTRC